MTELDFVSGEAGWRVRGSIKERIAARHTGRRFWPDALRRRLLAAADTAAVLVVAGCLALWDPTMTPALVVVASLPLWLLTAKLSGLYDLDHRSLRHLTVDELPRIFIWALAGTALLTIVTVVTGAPEVDSTDKIAIWLVLVPVATSLRAFVRALWRRIMPPERTLVVGAAGGVIGRKLELFPDLHIDIVRRLERLDAVDLTEPGFLDGIDRIVIESFQGANEAMIMLLKVARTAQVKISAVSSVSAALGIGAHVNQVGDLSLLEYHTWDIARTTLLGKRVVDIVGGLLALVLLAPLMVVAAIVIAVTDRRPVFFVQTRVGLHGRPFRMFKFRTMRVASIAAARPRDPFLPKLPDDPRVTRVGRLLRRWSVDELPQLVNVLRGEMSLVGPRPEESPIVDRYEPEHRLRLVVKPGMTGPMQVYGRGALTFEERLAADRVYIENLSVIRDLRILALTIAPVFRRQGAF